MAIERPEWINRPEYQRFPDRLESRDRLKEELESVLATRSTEEWMKAFAGKVPAAPVYDVAQALDNDFIQEQERIIEFEHAGRNVRTIASPVRVGVHPAQAAPAMGEHNHELLGEVGYSEEEIRSFKDEHVI